jgi:hypothetical protein
MQNKSLARTQNSCRKLGIENATHLIMSSKKETEKQKLSCKITSHQERGSKEVSGLSRCELGKEKKNLRPTIMNDTPHIGFVNSHSKCNSGYHNLPMIVPSLLEERFNTKFSLN